MNSKRKADLQRKLSMVSVPKPPAGLSDRIKQDIPQYLGVENDRARLTKSVTFNMRVAASILLLVSSAYLCLTILSRAPMSKEAGIPRVAQIAAPAAKSVAVIPNAAPPEIRQRVIAPNVPPVAPQRVADAMPPRSVAENIVLHRELASDEEKKKLQALGYSNAPAAQSEPVVAEALSDKRDIAAAVPLPQPPPPAPVVIPTVTPAPEQAMTENRITPSDAAHDVGRYAQRRAAPAPAPAPPPAMDAYDDKALARNETAVAGGAAAASGSAMEKMEKTLSRVDFVRDAHAAELDLDARRSVFGISVDGNAFEQVKTAIERGEHPSYVDVEALVNYFAGAAKRAPREVSLEAEASPAPINENGRTVFVRYTIDTARSEIPPKGSVPPIATDARVDVEFDPHAVANYRRVGGDAKTDAFESALLKNVSVTAVYAVELQPNVNVRTPLATVTLHYKNVTNGRTRSQTRLLRVGDVTRRWSDASRRHRLAALGAVWGEHLKSSTGGADVARRAEELAKQEPKDERAKELAALANASSR